MSAGLSDQFDTATAQFGQLVHDVSPDGWGDPTPCDEWSVHDLVNHLVNEALWITPLLDGATIAEVGDRFDGDLLGGDPVTAWDAAADQAIAAVASVDLGQAVHLSYGDVSAGHYLAQLTDDLVVHAWDLARGIGVDDGLDRDLVHATLERARSHADELAKSGMFGDPVDVPDDADEQTELLGLYGRDRRESV